MDAASVDDHRHPEAYKEWITSITDTFRSIPGIGLYMSRQLARSCCLRFAPANLDLETLQDIEAALEATEAATTSPGDAAALQAARDELERATLPLAALLMDDVAKAALSGKRLEDV